MERKDYCIGLDIGTNSTGYAMTDLDGALLKHKKRSTFGAVLFDKANTAQERRAFRSARRRLDRRKQRIDLLQNLMGPEVLKADPSFFLRLNESFLQEDERKYPHLYGTMPHSVWADGTSSDIPTIYHLRNALIHADRQADIRYVYLALHHIIKYRGNFLLEGQTLETLENDVSTLLTDILSQLCDTPYNWGFQTGDETVLEIYGILQEKGIGRSAKADKIVTALAPDKNSKAAAKALACLFVGSKSSLKSILNYDGENPEPSITLSDEWDEDSYMEALGDAGELFEEIVSIYRWQVFSSLRADGETISQTMIRRYEKHKSDLIMLKNWVRQFAPDEYRNFFKSVTPKSKNYVTYSGHYKKRDSGSQIIDTCTQEEFYKSVRALLGTNKSEEAVEAARTMLASMEVENGFLPLQRINFNGVIPNQIQAEEVSLIIDNQGAYYPGLKANREKILSLCSFRIPYYVGPLNTNSPFQKWLVRDKTQPARPWNFFEVVDKGQTANGFIENLTNKCTYLPTEDVLPLHSLLYEEYMLLDELNRVRINGKLIPVDLKEKIVDGLFKRVKHVTENTFVKWLRQNTVYGVMDRIEISGLHDDGAFAASLRSFIEFTTKAEIPVNGNTIEMIETLIRWSTIFEDRGILSEKIQETYPQLTEKQKRYICQRRYTGWGRLSKKLLDGIQGSKRAEGKTIMDMMRSTNDNFMKVINNDQYGFQDAIQACRPDVVTGKISLEEVQMLPGSPAIKRGIWQAVQIVEELVRHQGRLPKAIYIENTRGDDEKSKGRRLPDRLRIVEDLYTSCECKVPDECMENLEKCKKDKVHLTDRQYLYFLQLGKCMYSGKKLEFNELELYQIDHILPRSYYSDDSLDNRVLVYASENQRKSDDKLLLDSIRTRQTAWWVCLRQKKLISDRKYYNLTRNQVSEKDFLGFINRQLTETSQIIKHVIALFKDHYPDVSVHAVNARLTSTVRELYDLYKIRELNNTHHAYDAFLTCTLGAFTDKYLWWIGDDSVAGSMAKASWSSESKNGIVMGMFGRDQIDRSTGEVVWNAQQHIAYLKKVWCYRDHFIVYKKNEYSGTFYNISKRPAGSVEAKLPLKKELSVEKYGGYDSIKPAYIAAISYKKGKKRVGALINVPAYLAKVIENDPQALVQYAASKYQDVIILKPKILLNQKIVYEDSDLYLSSCSEARNAKELYLAEKYMKTVYQLTNKSEALWTYTEQDIDQLIKELNKKLNEHYPIYAGVSSRLKAAESKIKELNIIKKGSFALETLKIMKANGENAMYKKCIPELGINDNQGRITNKAFDLSKLILIDQSVTGFYERRTILWDSEQS